MEYPGVTVPRLYRAVLSLSAQGLRVSVLLGAGLTAAGLWLKTLGCGEDGFALAMAGQALVSVATLFVVSSAPPRMAAVWFPAHQVASAVGAAYLVIMVRHERKSRRFPVDIRCFVRILEDSVLKVSSKDRPCNIIHCSVHWQE